MEKRENSREIFIFSEERNQQADGFLARNSNPEILITADQTRFHWISCLGVLVYVKIGLSHSVFRGKLYDALAGA